MGLPSRLTARRHRSNRDVSSGLLFGSSRDSSIAISIANNSNSNSNSHHKRNSNSKRPSLFAVPPSSSPGDDLDRKKLRRSTVVVLVWTICLSVLVWPLSRLWKHHYHHNLQQLTDNDIPDDHGPIHKQFLLKTRHVRLSAFHK